MKYIKAHYHYTLREQTVNNSQSIPITNDRQAVEASLQTFVHSAMKFIDAPGFDMTIIIE